MTTLFWTRPYLGVSHLRGHSSLERRFLQVTVEDRGPFSTVAVLALRGGSPWDPVFEETCEGVEWARQAGERFLKNLFVRDFKEAGAAVTRLPVVPTPLRRVS
jgi:hypothetical protein